MGGNTRLDNDFEGQGMDLFLFSLSKEITIKQIYWMKEEREQAITHI
jgi:hypothetical protein